MKLLYAAAGCIILAIALNLTAIDWSSQATTRADITAQADIAVASRQAEAAMHAADRQAEAAIVAAKEETHRTALWAGVLPLALIIVGATGSLWIVLHYQARIRLHAAPPMPPLLLPQPPARVRRLAEEHGAVPALINGQWLLLRDGTPVARCRQLPGPPTRR